METLIIWLTSITIEDIQNIFISIPGVFLAGFSFYFAYQKIGDKVLVSFAIQHSRINETRITNLDLVNKKNKPISVFSIHAVINSDVVIELDVFSPPIILKPLESIQIITPPYSGLYLGNNKYEINHKTFDVIDIYLISYNKKIKCKVINSPSINKMYNFEHYKRASKDTRTFNGKVYNENVKYAIIYRYNSESYTALIENSGIIGDDWEFKHNCIPEEKMSSKDTVNDYLISLGFGKLFDVINVEDVN